MPFDYTGAQDLQGDAASTLTYRRAQWRFVLPPSASATPPKNPFMCALSSLPIPFVPCALSVHVSSRRGLPCPPHTYHPSHRSGPGGGEPCTVRLCEDFTEPRALLPLPCCTGRCAGQAVHTSGTLADQAGPSALFPHYFMRLGSHTWSRCLGNAAGPDPAPFSHHDSVRIVHLFTVTDASSSPRASSDRTQCTP